MSYFVRIDKPKKLRKSILQGAKEAILYQYRYNDYAELKRKKLALMDEMDEILDELHEKTEELLDELDVEELQDEIDEEQNEEDTSSDERGEQDTQADLSDEDRLKYTLERIESTLDDL